MQQINRNIELIRYRHYHSTDLLLFELVNAATAQTIQDEAYKKFGKAFIKYKTVTELYDQADTTLKDQYEALKDFVLALGDDVQLAIMKYYFAYKRIEIFCFIEMRPQIHSILVFVKVDPDTIDLDKNKGFLRDVRKLVISGRLEITIKTAGDLEQAKPYILKSNELN